MVKSRVRPVFVLTVIIAAFYGGLATRAIADQPYMHEALSELVQARATLAAGAADKGGHRVRAISLIDQAVAEVRAGIRFERTH